MPRLTVAIRRTGRSGRNEPEDDRAPATRVRKVAHPPPGPRLAPGARPEAHAPAARPETRAPAARPETRTPAARPETRTPAARPELMRRLKPERPQLVPKPAPRQLALKPTSPQRGLRLMRLQLTLKRTLRRRILNRVRPPNLNLVLPRKRSPRRTRRVVPLRQCIPNRVPRTGPSPALAPSGIARGQKPAPNRMLQGVRLRRLTLSRVLLRQCTPSPTRRLALQSILVPSPPRTLLLDRPLTLRQNMRRNRSPRRKNPSNRHVSCS